MCDKALICDANILIDYCDVDKSLITKLCAVFSLFIPDVILEEVGLLDRDEATALGVTIIDTPLGMLNDAIQALPGCSMQDTVCLLMAKEEGWACATNDKKLRSVCLDAGIEVIRGLRLLLILAEKNGSTVKSVGKIGGKFLGSA